MGAVVCSKSNRWRLHMNIHIFKKCSMLIHDYSHKRIVKGKYTHLPFNFTIPKCFINIRYKG